MKKNKHSPSKKIVNRRARHDYALGDGLVAGISLNGSETRALRSGRGNLTGAYVIVKDGEAWLVNATIMALPGTALKEEDQTRTRKLLVKKREIENLMSEKQKGQTIVPLEILTGGKFIKIRIAAGRGKKQYDKRQALKRRDDERRTQTVLRSRQ